MWVHPGRGIGPNRSKVYDWSGWTTETHPRLPSSPSPPSLREVVPTQDWTPIVVSYLRLSLCTRKSGSHRSTESHRDIPFEGLEGTGSLTNPSNPQQERRP